MLCSLCVRTLRHSRLWTLGHPLVGQEHNVGNCTNIKLNVSVEPIVRPSKDTDMQELEKEIRNELSIYNRTDSKIVKHRRKTTEMVSPRDIEQIVENHVIDSMRKGDFDNLPGFGKPFKEEYEHPFLEKGLAKINSILINEGCKPSWISLGNDIREGIAKARFKLALERSRLNSSTLKPQEEAKLRCHQDNFEKTILKLNEKVYKHNLQVPLIRMQKAAFSVDKEMKSVLDNYQKYIPADFKDTGVLGSAKQTQSLTDLWEDLVGVFQKTPI